MNWPWTSDVDKAPAVPAARKDTWIRGRPNMDDTEICCWFFRLDPVHLTEGSILRDLGITSPILTVGGPQIIATRGVPRR